METSGFESREWHRKDNPNIHAFKAYSWVDRVIILDESKGRLVIDDITYTEFQKGLANWEEIYGR